MSLRPKTLNYRVVWSEEDGEYVGLCSEYPSLSWVAPNHHEALDGIRRLVRKERVSIAAERFTERNAALLAKLAD